MGEDFRGLLGRLERAHEGAGGDEGELRHEGVERARDGAHAAPALGRQRSILVGAAEGGAILGDRVTYEQRAHGARM